MALICALKQLSLALLIKNKNLPDFKEDFFMADKNAFEKTAEAPRKLRIGIIGTGWIAESHVAAYKRQPDVEIVAATDLIPGKAEEIGRAHV